VARSIGFPVLVRPSYVLGGRAMVIAYDEDTVRRYMQEAVVFSQSRPVLIDRFLEDAIEVDVDAIADSTGAVLIAGIMEHIEEAGVHSGDSSCVLPPTSLPEPVLATIRSYTERLARALNVIGLMNVQYAVKNGVVYVLEVNPRASRTVPYVSKATGIALPKIAVGVMLGGKISDFTDATGVLKVPQFFVKSPVFPFNKFPGVDPTLGPEMRSTGEVMGIGENFGEAFAKAQLSAGTPLPEKGRVFLSVNDRDKTFAVTLARRFIELGFEVTATRGTAALIRAAGIPVKTVFKVNEGRPNAVDLLKAGSLDLIIYTATSGAHAFSDEKAIRRNAVTYRVPCITTMSGARASVEAIASRRRDPIRVWSLQEIHAPAEKPYSAAKR
jgi:carbamoyl-phosphate synthase large subunit